MCIYVYYIYKSQGGNLILDILLKTGINTPAIQLVDIVTLDIVTNGLRAKWVAISMWQVHLSVISQREWSHFCRSYETAQEKSYCS